MSKTTNTDPRDRQCPPWCTDECDPTSGVHYGDEARMLFVTDEPHVVRVQLDRGSEDTAPTVSTWLDCGEDNVIGVPPAVARELAAALMAAADRADGVER